MGEEKYSKFIATKLVQSLADSLFALSSIRITSLESISEKSNVFNQLGVYIKDLKDSKKAVDRAMSKYDSSTIKFNTVSSTNIKDSASISSNEKSSVNDIRIASANEQKLAIINENAIILADSKKLYISLALDFVYRVSVLKAYINSIIADRIFHSIDSIETRFLESAKVLYVLKIAAKEFHVDGISLDSASEVYSKWKDVIISISKR